MRLGLWEHGEAGCWLAGVAGVGDVQVSFGGVLARCAEADAACAAVDGGGRQRRAVVRCGSGVGPSGSSRVQHLSTGWMGGWTCAMPCCGEVVPGREPNREANEELVE